MTQPVVADNKPMKVSLTAGESYMFCACGRSESQPFCDGSHKGTGITPEKFTPEESGDAALCCCKHTSNAPYCDGTHKRFGSEDVGAEAP